MDGKRVVGAHKAILMNLSEYFRAVFSGPFSKNDEIEVVISEFPPGTFVEAITVVTICFFTYPDSFY